MEVIQSNSNNILVDVNLNEKIPSPMSKRKNSLHASLDIPKKCILKKIPYSCPSLGERKVRWVDLEDSSTCRQLAEIFPVEMYDRKPIYYQQQALDLNNALYNPQVNCYDAVVCIGTIFKESVFSYTGRITSFFNIRNSASD